MLWLILAFGSAALLGIYDVCKKKSLADNAVLPVLGLNTLFSSLIFLPFILVSIWKPELLQDSIFYVPEAGWEMHRLILVKSFIVLSSWIFGYYGMKHRPLTIVGPINATRPVMTLVGALLIFGERLNGWEWIGVLLAIFSFFLLSRSGKKEGLEFRHNRWILFLVLAAVLGAASGLYDKSLMTELDHMLWWPRRQKTTPFHWSWFIPLISIFLSAADFLYFYALGQEGAMISIISMVRRSSVLVSFLVGAFVFKEKNIRSKAWDLALVFLSTVFLFLGNVLA